MKQTGWSDELYAVSLSWHEAYQEKHRKALLRRSTRLLFCPLPLTQTFQELIKYLVAVPRKPVPAFRGSVQYPRLKLDNGRRCPVIQYGVNVVRTQIMG
jgi:hypothetical protein